MVIGATGQVGSKVARSLHGEGRELRAITHRAQARPPLPGIHLTHADLTDPDAARRALQGAHAVYLTPPEQGANPLELEQRVAENVLRAADEAQVAHIVMHTALHAEHEATGVPLLDAKRAIEIRAHELDVPVTLLRPGLFLEPLLRAGYQGRRDVISLPFEAGHPVGVVATRDVARAAVALLEQPASQRRAFDLHQPGGLSGEGLARILSQVYERPVAYQPVTGDLGPTVARLGKGPQEAALYAALLRYASEHAYVGEPEEILRAVDGFAYTPLERVLHEDIAPPRHATWRIEPAQA